MRQLEQREEEIHSFAPDIRYHNSQRERERDGPAGGPPPGAVFDELYERRDEFVLKRQALANQQRELAEQECTFQPRLSAYQAGSQREGPLLERMQSWQQDRETEIESKREKLQRERAEAEQRACTFRPCLEPTG
eukprot:SAG22_NODE_488_length_9853_cov_2.555054_5_plen_135_part_00